MELAPIVLFVYNRPENVKKVLDSLAKNELAKDSILYIYSDGPKENASERDLKGIKDVRELIANGKWCNEINIVISETNLGCAPSIIKGITEVVNKYGKIIILEDDLNLSPFFLQFMNESLNLYKDTMNVSSIGACNFFANGEKFPSSFFIPYPDCWGWATWSDRWSHFEFDAKTLLDQLTERGLIEKFNSYGAYNMEALLIAQAENKVSAWDIQWTATCILNDWLTLYPNPSISQHVYINNSTHAAINVLPPLMKESPKIIKSDVMIIPSVFEAMQLGYSGKGDFYGNKIKPKKNIAYFKQKVKLLVKKFIMFKALFIY